MKTLKILLIGQPNVGKSSLFNALAGPKAIVSNYPGTTVEVTRGEKVVKDVRITLIDTPGIYSISDRSEEEKVTERALFEEVADGAIIVSDATSLERSLYLALQMLEAQIPIVIAVNFVEEAEKKGVMINFKRLEILLNVPVIPVNPLMRKGINRLLNTLLWIKDRPSRGFVVEYDDHIEEAVTELSQQIIGTKLPKRFVALRILEDDEDFHKYLKDRHVIERVKSGLKAHPRIARDISIIRYGTASFIVKEVTRIVSLKKGIEFEEKTDRILLNKIWGPILTGVSFLLIFGTLLYLGNFIQDVLMSLAGKLSSSIGGGHSIVVTLLIQGLTGVTAGVSIALPYVFLFYLLLGLLEDVGLLSRFIVNAERILKRLGLPGRSFIPLALSLGCTAPATRATRILSSKKERFHTASLFSFIPCSSRTAIIMGIVGFYGGVKLALSVFITSLIAGLAWAYGIRKALNIRGEPLILELPPYRRPLIRNVLAKSWIRMNDFIYIVIPLLMVGGMAYGILKIIGLTDTIIGPLSPITNWLGLPPVTIIPLTFGFLQKDLTAPMLLSALGGEPSSALTSLQIYTFGVAATIGIPCIIALGILINELGLKEAVGLAVTSILYGLLVAGLAWRIIIGYTGFLF